MPKILFLTLHRPNRSPSQRFRFEQYLPFLEEYGFEYKWSYLLDARDDTYFYKRGNYVIKFGILLKSFLKRIKDILSKEKYDIVFIQRECFMLGTIFFEKQFSKKSKIVFDFDDAIWLQNISKANRSLAFLKDSNKTTSLIKMSDLVLAGNKYLENFASQFNSNVKIIPTTIDTIQHHNQLKKHIDKTVITIGWTGTHSTLKYLNLLDTVIQELNDKFKIQVLIICDSAPSFKWRNLEFIKWNKESEIDDLLKIDIGVMPLLDTEWAKGKCGFKILQYLSLGIPAIASPVGVNKTIIEDGINGFLADTDDEWIDKISRLISNTVLRNKIGKAGRQTVVEKYSVESNKHLYLESFKELLA